MLYADWFELIAALRYDGFSLEGDGVENDGDRVSPRLTVGVKPFEETALDGIQLYGTYAEGYRAPSVNETLIHGLHPSGVVFPFLPNADLKPETSRMLEIGVNFERDDLFVSGDGVRFKASWFRNDVDDYIDTEQLTAGQGDCPFYRNLVPVFRGGSYLPVCFQYTNVAEARIQGAEFELGYDAGMVFGSASLAVLDGENLTDRTDLISVPPTAVTGRLGFRALERRLTVGGEVEHVASATRNGVDLDDHTLVNVFASYEANERLRFDVRLNNVFDEAYVNYFNAVAGGDAGKYEEGFNAKFAVTLRFGADGAGIPPTLN